jgi:ferredoxin
LEDKQIMAKKVSINKDLCIGCGACTGTCPDVFAIGDDGKAEVIGTGDDAAIDEAAASCPVGAIEAK